MTASPPYLLKPLYRHIGAFLQGIRNIFPQQIITVTGISDKQNPALIIYRHAFPRRMSQCIMNLPCKPVALFGLRHLLAHIGIFGELCIDSLQLSVQCIDFFDRPSLHADHIDAVYNKHDDIQGEQDIVNTEQILLCGEIVILYIIRLLHLSHRGNRDENFLF